MASPQFPFEKLHMCSLAYKDASNTNKLQVSDFKRRNTKCTLKGKIKVTTQMGVVYSHLQRGKSYVRTLLESASGTYWQQRHGRYSLSKKRSIGWTPPSLSDTIQIISCFVGSGVAGDGGGRPAACVVFSSRYDAWVSVQCSRYPVHLMNLESWDYVLGLWITLCIMQDNCTFYIADLLLPLLHFACLRL